ncbi:MAG: DUF4388 domain-containing protein [Acidobacteriota bacterium]
MELPDRPERSVFEGSLEYIPLSDIIQMLQVGAKTGILFLRRDDGQSAVVAFRAGAVIQAVHRESYQTLGDRLVNGGVINRIDLQEALTHMTRFPGMRIGDALVELGFITRNRIEDEVKAQMTETVEKLLGWTDTEFEFRVGFVSLVDGLSVDLLHGKGVSPVKLLLEASALQDKRDRERDFFERALETSSAGQGGGRR